MRKRFVVICVLMAGVTAAGHGCKQKNGGMEDFSRALNMQYESYTIIKDNSSDPARAGRLFTAYYKKNRDAMADAFKGYYRKYGDGSNLSKEEAAFLDNEMNKVNALLADKEIQKVMDDPAFVDTAREGTAILTEIREKAK